MKNKIFSIVSILSIFLFAACEPTEYRVPLENSYDPSVPLDIQVTQTGNNGNGITLKVLTPGVYGEWNYGVGTKRTDEVSFNWIATGTAKFTFTVFNQVATEDETGLIKAESGFKQEVTVQVDELDQPLADQYNFLCGSDLAAGKTWVLDGTGGDKRLWWYMCPAGDPSKWQEAWWNAGGECCPPSDAMGSMHFDLNGGANYSRTTAAGATPVKGSFAFSPDFTKITISGEDSHLLGYDATREPVGGEYVIVELTENKLVLYAMTNGGGTGWVWVFKSV